MKTLNLTTAVAVLVTLTLAMVPALAQDTDKPQAKDQQIRPAEQRQTQPKREGGLTREQVLQQEDKQKGTEEGMPNIRGQRDDRQGAEGQKAQPQFHVLPRYYPQWKLGVYAYNTDTGVVITHVIPQSAAWRAGLEPGDRIVTVGGYQVGWIEHWLYPLGAELQRRADGYGGVQLLLQNVRNNELLTRRVQLDGRGIRHRAARPDFDR